MYEGAIQDLIDALGSLPGVGPKSAQRIAFHLLQADPQDVQRLVQTLSEVKDKVAFCETCGNVAEGPQEVIEAAARARNRAAVPPRSDLAPRRSPTRLPPEAAPPRPASPTRRPPRDH